jgi:hypothetical protein
MLASETLDPTVRDHFKQVTKDNVSSFEWIADAVLRMACSFGHFLEMLDVGILASVQPAVPEGLKNLAPGF